MKPSMSLVLVLALPASTARAGLELTVYEEPGAAWTTVVGIDAEEDDEEVLCGASWPDEELHAMFFRKASEVSDVGLERIQINGTGPKDIVCYFTGKSSVSVCPILSLKVPKRPFDVVSCIESEGTKRPKVTVGDLDGDGFGDLILDGSRKYRFRPELADFVDASAPKKAVTLAEMIERTPYKDKVRKNGSGQIVRLVLGHRDYHPWRVPDELFDLTELASLTIEGNLATLPIGIGRLTKLEELNLRDHQLTQLPPSINELAALEKLSVSGNGLQDLPADMAGMASLTDLDLSSNEISDLPAVLCQLTAIETLYVRWSNVETVPVCLLTPTLTELHLDGNRIAWIPGPAHGHKLRRLSVAKNALKTVPLWIGELDHLKYIDLSRNPLEWLPASLAELPKIANVSGYSPKCAVKKHTSARAAFTACYKGVPWKKVAPKYRGVKVQVLAPKAILGLVKQKVVPTLTNATVKPANVAPALKERTESVVYFAEGLEAEALGLATAMPGGAEIEKLSWKSKFPLVVAVGAEAVR